MRSHLHHQEQAHLGQSGRIQVQPWMHLAWAQLSGQEDPNKRDLHLRLAHQEQMKAHVAAISGGRQRGGNRSRFELR